MTSQSVVAGTSVNANKKIILTVTDINDTPSVSDEKQEANNKSSIENNKKEVTSYSFKSYDKKQDTSKDEEIDTLLLATELDLIAREKSSGIHYSISRDGNTININLWQDGMTEAAVYVKDGTLPKSQWTTVMDTMKDYSLTVYSDYKPYGIDVVVNLLNNFNMENTLATFKNGKKYMTLLVSRH